jgi:hypothetical protein
MPVIGQVDISDIIGSLGDPNHGLKAADGPARNAEQQDEDFIYRATWGPVDMSTQMAMEPAWDLIWDVNGYYRALGLTWPFDDDRKALRLAYQDRNGQDDEYLTYVIKQLLQPKVRKAYDKMPLGSRFRDKYVMEEEKRLLSKTAKELSEAEGKLITVDDLVNEINEDRAIRERIERRKQLHNPTWEWGFYLLKTRKSEYENLISWQEFLTHAFHARGVVKVISIGYIGDSKQPFVVKTWSGKTIFFLSDEVSASLELAETAVSNYLLL